MSNRKYYKTTQTTTVQCFVIKNLNYPKPSLGINHRVVYLGKALEPQQIPLLEVLVLGVDEDAHSSVFALASIGLLTLEPGAVAVGHVLRHILAGYDVVGGAFGFSTELHEHVVVVLGGELLCLVGQDPALVPVLRALALDRDGSLGLSVGGQDIDATGVAHRDRGDEATSGKLGRDEIFAGYSG